MALAQALATAPTVRDHGAGRDGDPVVAAAVLLGLVRGHAASWRHMQEQADQLLTRLAEARPPAAVAAAATRGQALSLDAVLAVAAATDDPARPSSGMARDTRL